MMVVFPFLSLSPLLFLSRCREHRLSLSLQLIACHLRGLVCVSFVQSSLFYPQSSLFPHSLPPSVTRREVTTSGVQTLSLLIRRSRTKWSTYYNLMVHSKGFQDEESEEVINYHDLSN